VITPLSLLSECGLYPAYPACLLLSGCDFTGCLDGADLRAARLGGAFLDGASLRQADLRGAYVRVARFDGADLSAADLRDTQGLVRAQLAAA
jgi:hypothetical protein